ncbi:hypothetical protein [Wolbachia endosymbiont of Nasonia giraulti]|uniref:hypothetical protein n=1 Tax=Wolbachia endosymbiont of Nasonia giraulti TaxID=180838 RepID=UPI003A8B08FA
MNSEKLLYSRARYAHLYRVEDVMQVADTGIQFFLCNSVKKKRFRVYQLSWIPVSSTGMTPKRLLE